jgi:pyruvate dehydrogenase E1 component alpha subunit
VWKLPILFVCEDNGFAATTRTHAMTAGEGPAARAESLGIAATIVDGNDILAVDETVRRLVGEIRIGGGPRFLLCRTYRLTGHTAADAAGYRSKEEVQAAWTSDPVARTRNLLATAGVADSEIAAAEAAARCEIDAAFAAAKASPFPPPARAFADVQDVGDPRREAF